MATARLSPGRAFPRDPADHFLALRSGVILKPRQIMVVRPHAHLAARVRVLKPAALPIALPRQPIVSFLAREVRAPTPHMKGFPHVQVLLILSSLKHSEAVCLRLDISCGLRHRFEEFEKLKLV